MSYYVQGNNTDFSTITKLRDDSSNYFEWKKAITALLRSKGMLGACCPTEKLSASMMYAERMAADTTQKLAKLQLKRFTAKSEAVWMLNQTISNSHQIDVEGMDHAAKVWVRLRPVLTHTDGDRRISDATGTVDGICSWGGEDMERIPVSKTGSTPVHW